MKNVVMTLAASSMLLTGCCNKTASGAIIGAAAGAGVGALVGGSAGAAWGAGIGGASGLAVGAYMDDCCCGKCNSCCPPKCKQNKCCKPKPSCCKPCCPTISQRCPATAERVEQGQPLSMNDIIDMSRKGVSDEAIVDQAKASGIDFHMDNGSANHLRNAGVSQKVIDGLQN